MTVFFYNMLMRKYIDLNSDIGEGFGGYTCGLDDEMIKHITSANIACGWHAGDPMIMRKTALRCVERGVQIGAHPGFPDLLGFGRRNLAVTPAEARAYTLYQLGALYGMVSGLNAAEVSAHLPGFSRLSGSALRTEDDGSVIRASEDGAKNDENGFEKGVGNNFKNSKFQKPAVRHVKLHGAFYNLAAKDQAIADAVIDGIASYDDRCIIVTLSGSYMAKAAKRLGLRVAEEVFADRGYQSDGTLVPRNLPGAFVHDREFAIRRVISMAKESRVQAVDGSEIEIQADTICVHGDNPEALAFVRDIRKALEASGVTVAPMHSFI